MRLPSPTPLRGLLRCLDAGFFIPSFEEEGYESVGDLRKAGEPTVAEFMQCLSMPRSVDDRLLGFAFAREPDAQVTAAAGMPAMDTAVPDVNDPQASAAAAVACSSRALDARWLQAVSPLYNLKMGCENMGPLLYSLARFVKPVRCLEIGAGYTSAFLLQALADNAAEIEAWSRWSATLENPAQSESWLAPGFPPHCEANGGESAVLHCVDNLAHAGSTTPQLFDVAQRLGLEPWLQLHLDDARAFLSESESTIPSFDLVWLDGLLDFAPPIRGDVAGGIDAFLSLVWPRVSAGGFVLLHSTLTNSAVRRWLARVEDASWGPPGAVISLMEPFKRFQNSVTLLQRRPPNYAEPIYSSLP